MVRRFFAILELPPLSLFLVCFCQLLLTLSVIISLHLQTDTTPADWHHNLAVFTQLLDIAHHFYYIVFHFTPWDYGIYYGTETVKLYTNIAKNYKIISGFLDVISRLVRVLTYLYRYRTARSSS